MKRTPSMTVRQFVETHSYAQDRGGTRGIRGCHPDEAIPTSSQSRSMVGRPGMLASIHESSIAARTFDRGRSRIARVRDPSPPDPENPSMASYQQMLFEDAPTRADVDEPSDERRRRLNRER
jgi:hypothetical protein